MYKKFRNDFTMLELLLVVAVMIILSSLLLPALKGAKEKARQIQCIENLKQVGLASIMYCNDNNGWFAIYDDTILVTWRGAYGYQLMWHMQLYNNGYIKNGNSFICPSYPPSGYGHSWRTYGVDRRLGSDLFKAYFQLFNKANPSNTIFLADTAIYGDGFWGYQCSLYYRTTITGGMGLIHLRHGNSASGSFLDGHAESCDASRLKNLSVTKCMGKYLNVISQ